MIKSVKKRDGSISRFNRDKIERSIEKAALTALKERRAALVSKNITNFVIEKSEIYILWLIN